LPKISPNLRCTPLETAGSTQKSVQRPSVEFFKNFTNIEKDIYSIQHSSSCQSRKFPTFYGIWRFITTFTSFHHL